MSPGAGRLTLRDVTLTGGLAKGGDAFAGGGGGGMGGAIFSQGTVLVERSTLAGNTARGGSARNLDAGTGGGGIGGNAPKSATGGGGGFGFDPMVGPSGGAGGGAGLGGAVFTMQGRLAIRASTLAGNAAIGGEDAVPDGAKGVGGAVFNLNGTFAATGSTIAANTADFDGAGIYNLVWDGATDRTAETTLRSTIVEGLVSSKPPSVFVKENRGTARADLSGRNLVRRPAARDGGAITGAALDADPQLGTLRMNGGLTATLAPAATSPVIDAGAASGLATDQRGLSRTVDQPGRPDTADGTDIGAVELPLAAVARFGARTGVTLRLARKRIRGRLPVRAINRNGFAVRGRLAAMGRARRFTVGAGGETTVRLKLTRKLSRRLTHKGRIAIRVRARVTDPAGGTRIVARRLSPRAAR